jgi:hypothetical protein
MTWAAIQKAASGACCSAWGEFPVFELDDAEIITHSTATTTYYACTLHHAGHAKNGFARILSMGWLDRKNCCYSYKRKFPFHITLLARISHEGIKESG